MTQQRYPASSVGLEKAITAYVIAAGGAMLVSGEAAHASIIYSGIQDVEIGLDGVFDLDLDGDSVVDFGVVNDFQQGSGKGDLDLVLLTVQPTGSNRIAGDASGSEAAVLGAGEPIPGNLDLSSNTLTMASSVPQREQTDGPWFGVIDGYLGLEFAIGNDTFYGWTRISVPDEVLQQGKSGPHLVPNLDLITTIHDWAYEDVAGTPILAGATSDGPTPVPVPSSLALFAAGASGILAMRRARRRSGDYSERTK